MGDKYQFSISKRRRPSLWTKMMSKQRVQFNDADLLTMSPSKGPKMPLHTLMGLRVHLACVLAHFARRLLLSRNSAFSSQNSIVRTFPCTFCSARFFRAGLKFCDVCGSAMPSRVSSGCHRMAKFPLMDVQIVHGCHHKAEYMDVTTWQSFLCPSTTAQRYL